MPVDPARRTLVQGPPSKGDRLVYDSVAYDVTGVSRYKEDDYQVTEWCCETSSSECYLLRETKSGAPPRWFFTRWIPTREVSLPGGAGLPAWKEPQDPPPPPKTLMRGGDIFTYAETTDGKYEDDDGLRQRKITWDYWNAGRARNVAIELWADGGQDCYTGVYIRPDEVSCRPISRLSAGGDGADWLGGFGPFARFGILLAGCYLFIMFFIGLPFDECLAAALPAALFFNLAVYQTLWIELLASGLAAVGLTFLFSRHPPLGDFVGLAGLLAAPALTALLCRRLRTPGDAARFICASSSAAPAALVGYYHYFAHAPAPHELGQLLLALGPAGVAAMAGLAAAQLAAGSEEPA